MPKTNIELFGPDRDDTAHRLDRYGKVKAVERLCKEELELLRDRFELEADAMEELTGGAYNVPVKGVGRVLRTDPEVKLYVEDEQRVTKWLLENDPGLTKQKLDARLTLDAENLQVLVDKCDEALEKDHDDDTLSYLLGCLLDAIAINWRFLLPEDVVGTLEGVGYVKSEDRLIHPETGEAVPGIGTKQARRQLTVTIEKQAKTRHDRELRASLQLTDGSN